MKLNLVLIFAAFLISAFGVSAQQPAREELILENGIASHKGLDDVYRRFSEGYRKLDAAMVANLYTETAAYLAPGSDMNIGRQKVLENFKGFFDPVRKRNGKLEISFRIVQRAVDRNLAYDVGIYTVTSINEKGESRAKSGKFVVAARRGGGVWRFQVDGYNDLLKQTK